MIVCGGAATWWDAMVKAKIEHRRDEDLVVRMNCGKSIISYVERLY